jgi:hypothetical protein
MKPKPIEIYISFEQARVIKLRDEFLKDGKPFIVTSIKIAPNSFREDGKIVYNSKIEAEEKWFYLKRIRVPCHDCEDLTSSDCTYESCPKRL